MKGGFKLITVLTNYTKRNLKTRPNKQPGQTNQTRANVISYERRSKRRSKKLSEKRKKYKIKEQNRASKTRQSKTKQRVTV